MIRNDRTFMDLTGRLVAEGRLELFLSGYDEPILATLTREDRIEQVVRMREALRREFGVDAETLWLTERVWEPDLPAELARSGVKSVLVDDRHFLVSGFQREELHLPYRTESDGRSVTLFPIDERLRYLVPFRAQRRRRSTSARCGHRAHGWRCWPTTARSSGGGPAPGNGSGRAAGWTATSR
jgi:4-alpha-glucanotransferase